MAQRFVRIDLSPASRDFRPLALEPGLALLDRDGAGAKLLFRWLGRLAADPEWDDDSVNFWVRDDHGARFEDLICYPATRNDIKETLADELELLRQRINAIRPENATERAVHRALVQSFRDLADEPYRIDSDVGFFRYRDVQGHWRLVWCWGYQRLDQEQAPAVVCTDPDCNLLYLRRPGQSAKCPSCAAILASLRKKRKPWRRPSLSRLLAFLLLLLLLAGAFLFFTARGQHLWARYFERLRVTPATWAGPVGSRTEFKITQGNIFHREDVTRQAVALIHDPHVVRYDPFTGRATAISPGNTPIDFYVSNTKVSANISVSPAKNPQRIRIKPDTLALGVGTTARLQLLGEYDDGTQADLTDVALWSAQNDGIVFACNGLVEGIAEGASTVTARYRATPDSNYLDASVAVSVAKMDIKSLEAKIAPLPVMVGRASNLHVDLVAADGKRYSVAGSSLLDATVVPPEVAGIVGGQVRGLTTGQAQLVLAYQGVPEPVYERFPVTSAPNPDELIVQPKNLDLVVGEIADLSIASPGNESLQVASSAPAVVEVTRSNRLIGRRPGTAQVTVTLGNSKATVNVTVASVVFQAIAVDPIRVAVAVDDSVPVRVMGRIDAEHWVEIAPDRLTIEKSPSLQFAQFDAKTMQLQGIRPTEPARPQSLAFSTAALHSSAPVEVVMSPLRLELTPFSIPELPLGKPGQWWIDLPLGQSVQIHGWATYHGSRRMEVPAERIQWRYKPEGDASKTFQVHNGRIGALKPEGSLAVWGSYFGRESNRVDVKAAAAAPVTLRLEAAPASLAVGAAGRTKLSAQGGQGPVELIEDMTAYSSSDDRLLAVGKQTGAYRAMASGEATLTVSHPAAQQPATAKVTVTGPAAAPRGDVPVVVKIVSDQGPMVRFPVGAQFDDFRVEAEYADGVTRMVTKKATLRASQPADQAPLAPEGGRLVGVRPGQTTVQAEFEGVHSQKGLDAVVTAELDADEIRLAPSPATILPGETIALDAIGYKDGKSVGILTGFGRAIWKSSDEHVARNVGPAVTGVGLGQAAVTAQLGAVTSKPATVSVVDSIAEPLVIDPRQIHLLVGESRQIGVDLMVSRGAVDLSRQCTVTPALPDVVRYNPATHSLVGVSPGVSPVAFVWGDKVVNATVEVTGGVPLRGEVIVEPANAVLSPGQAVDLRVFVLDRDGRRVDYTDTAVLASSDPAKVSVRGNKASAMTPGTAVITATLPGNNEHGAALVSVNNEKLTALVVEPSSLAMSVGDHAQLKVLARSPTGAFELSPLAGLTATVEGPNPAAVKIFGATQLDALSAGQADVTLQLKDGLSQKVPVTVTADRLTDLQIEPNATTVQPGDRLVYQVTGTRGGRRRVLGSDDGVSLSVTQPDVAQATGGMSVLAARPGRTAVVAQVGNQQAEASLTVAGEEANVVLRDHLGRVVQRGLGQRVVLPDDVVLREGEVVVPGIGIGGGIDYAPTAGVVALRFVPQVLRLPLGSPGSSVRVVEVLADGSTGRDVTTDPAVQIDRPQEIATLDRTATGITVRPVKPGQTQIEARSGQLTAVPLLVDVGDSADAAAHLEATPDPLSLWSGESGALGSVRVVPSTGQTPFEANYRLSLLGAPGVVAVEGDRRLRGVAPGTATVQVTAVDLAAPYNGLSTVVQVQVGEAGRLSIEPGQLALQVGQATPRFSVVLHGAGGDTSEVSAVLDSTDPHVLAPDPQIPGRFIAKDYGGTQVRAVYRGHEALANVTISGKRFTSVNTSLNEGPDDFDVTIDVTADAAEGPLEYRVTAPGQPPPAAWQPAETAGDSRHVVLHSPRMQYRGPAAQYRLIIEARDPAGASTQQYPFTFRLVPKLERTDTPVGKPGMNTP